MSDAKTPKPETGASAVADERQAGPWDDQAKRAFVNKEISEYFDPCQEAAKMSIRCLRRNDGDRTFCHDYFQAYRDCKKEWMDKVKEERKRLGRNAIW